MEDGSWRRMKRGGHGGKFPLRHPYRLGQLRTTTRRYTHNFESLIFCPPYCLRRSHLKKRRRQGCPVIVCTVECRTETVSSLHLYLRLLLLLQNLTPLTDCPYDLIAPTSLQSNRCWVDSPLPSFQVWIVGRNGI
jgi:hypothetical protein